MPSDVTKPHNKETINNINMDKINIIIVIRKFQYPRNLKDKNQMMRYNKFKIEC